MSYPVFGTDHGTLCVYPVGLEAQTKPLAQAGILVRLRVVMSLTIISLPKTIAECQCCAIVSSLVRHVAHLRMQVSFSSGASRERPGERGSTITQARERDGFVLFS